MRLLSKIKQEKDNLILHTRCILSTSKESVFNKVSFVSQFANPKWAERILKDGQSKTSDPDWRLSGAESVAEYEKWVTTTCGMACTVMVLDFFRQGSYKTIQLAKDAMNHGVYQEHQDELSSMRYKEFTEWIFNYGLEARVYTKLSLKGIEFLLSKQALVIVSVNPNIRGYQTADSNQKGGHLILVVGYDLSKDTITIHNPSGFVSQKTHAYHTMSVSEFKKYYAGRGIALGLAE